MTACIPSHGVSGSSASTGCRMNRPVRPERPSRGGPPRGSPAAVGSRRSWVGPSRPRSPGRRTAPAPAPAQGVLDRIDEVEHVDAGVGQAAAQRFDARGHDVAELFPVTVGEIGEPLTCGRHVVGQRGRATRSRSRSTSRAGRPCRRRAWRPPVRCGRSRSRLTISTQPAEGLRVVHGQHDGALGRRSARRRRPCRRRTRPGPATPCSPAKAPTRAEALRESQPWAPASGGVQVPDERDLLRARARRARRRGGC